MSEWTFVEGFGNKLFRGELGNLEEGQWHIQIPGANSELVGMKIFGDALFFDKHYEFYARRKGTLGLWYNGKFTAWADIEGPTLIHLNAQVPICNFPGSVFRDVKFTNEWIANSI